MKIVSDFNANKLKIYTENNILILAFEYPSSVKLNTHIFITNSKIIFIIHC